MIHFKHIQIGDFFAIQYSFDQEGESLPAHKHLKSEAHFTIVLKGKIELRTEASSEIIMAGEIAKIQWDLIHEISCLLPETSILNVFLFGMPDYYGNLAENEKNGVVSAL